MQPTTNSEDESQTNSPSQSESDGERFSTDGTETPAGSLREAVDRAMAACDSVAGVVVAHLPSHARPHQLLLTVYTADPVSLGEQIAHFEAEIPCTNDAGEVDTRQVPVEVLADPYGPQRWNSKTTTTVYVTDGGEAEGLSLDDGVDYLEAKLARPDAWEVEDGQQVSLDAIRTGFDA